MSDHDVCALMVAAFTAAFAALSRTPEAIGEIYVFSDFPREVNDELSQLAWVKDALSKANELNG